MENRNNDRAKKGTKIIILFVIVFGIIFFFYWFFYLKNFVSTDDAYVYADSSYVSSRIPGTIEKVYVKNDDYVKQGDLLVLLDSSIYKLKVEQLKNKLESINFKIKSTEIDVDILRHNLKKNINKSQNDLNLALDEKSRVNSEIKSLIAQKNSLKQDLHLSELQYKRYKNLYKNHTISKEKFDQVETMYNKLIYQIKSITHKINSLQAIYKELDEKIKNAHIGISIAKKNESKILSAIESLNSLKKERDYLRAALNEARLQLSYCKIKAPISGYVAGSKLQRGNRVLPGQVLMVIVPLDKVYVEANFKETQLANVRIGQRAEIEADMYPDVVFRGHVVGIRAGTGQVFSLLPPENASGNWIKVVQRIPVKIELDDYDYKKMPLRLGSSLVVKVDIRDKSGKTLK
ncbi:multidrug efflux MFS transporter adaptor subunit VceA [Desulfothermus okinawensis JCM 13304]